MSGSDAMFVGRLQELAILERLLALNSPTRVVACWGPPGIGKSTLLRQLLRRADGWHVLLLDLETSDIDGSDLGDSFVSADGLLFRLAKMFAYRDGVGQSVPARRNIGRFRGFEKRVALAARHLLASVGEVNVSQSASLGGQV